MDFQSFRQKFPLLAFSLVEALNLDQKLYKYKGGFGLLCLWLNAHYTRSQGHFRSLFCYWLVAGNLGILRLVRILVGFNIAVRCSVAFSFRFIDHPVDRIVSLHCNCMGNQSSLLIASLT